MKIKGPKDFWAGVMFIGSGLFFAAWAVTHYQMGSAVRMGPAYFPAVLGGLLAVLGLIILLGSLALGDETKPAMPFNLIDLFIVVAIYVAASYLAQAMGVSPDWVIVGATVVVCVLAVVFRPDAQGLALISAGCVFYGYLMKPLGLVVATAALVYVSAFGGHEFKWKEVTILYVILMLFSWLVFVKGLALPFPMWPAAYS
jgi:hypothetical protein